MTSTPIFVGIDIAKADFVVACRPAGTSWTTPNAAAGIAATVDRLRALAPSLIVLEATGGYETALVVALAAAALPVVVANPRQVHDFGKATGQQAKTDRLDAQLLALFAERVQPAPRPVPDAALQQLAALSTRRRQLLDMLTAERNRLEHAAAPVRREITRHIHWLERRVTAVEPVDGSVTGGGRWFGYGIATGSQTEFPFTPMYNSPSSDFESDDRGYLLKGSVSLPVRRPDQRLRHPVRGVPHRRRQQLPGLHRLGNDPPQSGCVYADQALIRPDTTTNYEVGLRRAWRDERFTLSATVFHVDWTDIQVAGLTPFSAEPITLNGGGAVSRGVELASAATLANAWRLHGSWSYTRAELSRDSPGLLDDGADAFEGDRLSGAPRHQGSLLTSYVTRLGSGTFELQYGYSYIGDVLTRIGMHAGGETLPAYDVHNVSASLSKDAWTLTFYADNLFDAYAVTSVRQTPDRIGHTEDGFRSRRYFANVLTPRRAGVSGTRSGHFPPNLSNSAV